MPKFFQKFEKIDKVFLGMVIALMAIGLIMFVSASLGILARSEDKFYGVLINQLISVGVSIIVLFITFLIPYTFWRKNALPILIGGIILTALVFIPGISFEHGGARRWLSISSFQFQPAEFLKIAFVMYLSAWLVWAKKRIKHLKKIVLPLVGIVVAITLILLRQPDTKSLILIIVASATMCIVAGIPWKYVIGFGGGVIIAFLILAKTVPYLEQRVDTFLHPTRDSQGAGWQITQSLSAIGSGEVFGRGLGQSVQKFGNLPEPQGDSIFAVLGEEFGFVGTSIVVVLYLVLGLRGLRIAHRAPDEFSRLLVTGLVILLIAQSYLNIAALVGLFPLTGVPLIFMSHGGTSLLTSLAAVGIILNVSKHQKKIPSSKE